MDVRDRARSDLYLAQLRTQSAPTTPGFHKTPMSPSFPAHLHDNDNDAINAAEYGENIQYAQKHHSISQPKPFALQAPPIRVHNATPTLRQDGFEPAPQQVQEHVPAAPGEETYDAVPIPGAYSSPVASPSCQPPSMNFGSFPHHAGDFESPPSSPRLQRVSLR